MDLVDVVGMPRRLRALLDHARPVETQPGGWYRFENTAGDGDVDAELILYSEIGGWFGVEAAEFATALTGVTANRLTVRLNSPGGSVFDGIAIANLLRSHHARVTMVVDGIAASIASVIALAGDEIIMQPQSQMMIHDAMGVCIGNQADMGEMADLLNRQSDNIARAYASRAGGRYDTWRSRMRAETWYSAEEAVAAGLADRVAQYPRQAAEPDTTARTDVRVWNLSVFRYAGREQAPHPDTADIAARMQADNTAIAEAVDAALAAGHNDMIRNAVSTEAADTGPQATAEPEPADDWAAAIAHLTITSADGWADAIAQMRGAP